MLAHNILDLSAFQQFCSVPRDKNNIPTSAAKGCVFTVCFLDNSAAAVSFNRAAKLFSGCDTDTANTRAVFQYISNQRRIRLRSASSIDSAEVAVLLKCYYFRQNNQSVRSWVLKPYCVIYQYESIFLPFALRRARTLRPFLSDILLRKPCSILLWRFFG